MSDEKTTTTVTETTKATPAPETAGPLGNVTDAVTGRAAEVEKTVETTTETVEDQSDSAV